MVDSIANWVGSKDRLEHSLLEIEADRLLRQHGADDLVEEVRVGELSLDTDFFAQASLIPGRRVSMMTVPRESPMELNCGESQHSLIERALDPE